MGGGGGGNNQQAMMMAMMMMQMQQQAAAQQQQLAKDALKRTQGYETTNLGRYKDLIANQNTKIGDIWSKYNNNIDQILKINPTYSANKKYTFTPYAMKDGFAASDFVDDGVDTDQKQADENIKLLDGWYSNLDKQAFGDLKNAEKMLASSQVWLNDARQQQDIMGRVLPGAPPGSWGGGGERVSGNAGADTLGGGTAGRGVGVDWTGPNPTQTQGSGFVGDRPSKGGELASMFSEAVSPRKQAQPAGMF